MSSIIVKVTRDQHRRVKKAAKDAEQTVSDYVRARLELAVTRGETQTSAPRSLKTYTTKREA